MSEQLPLAGTNPHQQVQLVYAMPPQQQQSDDEIDLGQLWSAIWAGKWWIMGISLLAGALAAVIAIQMPNIYRAKVVVAPSEEAQGSGLGAMAGQLGGLASLAGVNSGGGQVDKAGYAQEVMKSRAFIVAFIRRHDLLVPLMALKGWDLEQNQLLIDESLYDSASQRWVREVKAPQQPQPSDWEAYEAFQDIFVISPDKESGMVTITVDHYSPVIAAEWASLLVTDINDAMRDADVREVRRSIDFLKEHLNKTNVTEVQNIFYQLIEQQTKTIMLAEVRPEYIFKTVDPAVAPEKKEKPKRLLIVVAFTVLAGVWAALIFMIRRLTKVAKGNLIR